MIAKSGQGSFFIDITIMDFDRFPDRTRLFRPRFPKGGKSAGIPLIKPEGEMGQEGFQGLGKVARVPGFNQHGCGGAVNGHGFF